MVNLLNKSPIMCLLAVMALYMLNLSPELKSIAYYNSIFI